jgi:signal transduction histidine kinase
MYTLIDYASQPAILGHVLDATQEKRMEAMLWNTERELRVLSWKLLTAQETERKRIASELHDGIGQHLNGIRFTLENFIEGMGKAVDLDMSQLMRVISLTNETIDEVRIIAMALRPSLLDDLGIASTLSWHCRKFQETYSNIKIETNIDIQECPIQNSLEIVIYRIVQEALNNVAKHARADLAHVRLTQIPGKGIQLSVEDNGQGFELGDVLTKDSSKRGLGMVGMRERTELSGGTFAIESNLGVGTIVRASWPARELNPIS